MVDIPVKWTIEAAIGSNIASTELDSKTNGTATVLTAILDMSDTEYMNAVIEYVTGTFGAATSGSFLCELFCSPDGTNYVDQQTGSACHYRSKAVTSSTAAKRICFEFENLPPLKYKIMITNSTGQTTPATGNTVKVRKWRERAETV